MFEIKCSIPLEKDLEIRVMDYNALLADEGRSACSCHVLKRAKFPLRVC